MEIQEFSDSLEQSTPAWSSGRDDGPSLILGPGITGFGRWLKQFREGRNHFSGCVPTTQATHRGRLGSGPENRNETKVD